MSSEERTSLPVAGDARTLYVVDISGYVFRAFHALPPLSNARGEPTGAVLGVTTMLQKLITDQRPAMLAMAFDSPVRSFRVQQYAGYKATRPPAPVDLARQMARVREVIAAYRFPVFQQDGMEADDVIATLIKCARREGLCSVVVSSDKDLLQLIGPDVWMLDTMRNAVFGPREVEAKFGVKPAQMRDYLALVGDSSDNVPGVRSVGPKTATQLLQEHGDLERLYAELDKVERKALRQKLEEHRADAFMSRQLVSLRDDLELGIDCTQLARPEPDRERLRALFVELDFPRLIAALDGLPSAAKAKAAGEGSVAAGAQTEMDLGAASAPQSAPAAQPVEVPAVPVEIISSEAELAALTRALLESDSIALGCVMEGPHPVSGKLVGLGVAFGARAAYVPIGHDYLGRPDQLAQERVLAALREVFERERPAKICADSKREGTVLAALGIRLEGVRFDTMLASYLIDPERHSHGLQDIARFELERALLPEDLALLEHRAAPGVLSAIGVESMAQRSGKLLRLTLAAAELLAPRLEAAGCAKLLHEIELPLARVLIDVELTGVRVDTGLLARLAQTVGTQLVDIEQKCRQIAGRDFNVGSPRQLEAILFDELKLPVVKRTKTARSTDAAVLEELAALHELPAAILEHRMLAKLKSTYLEALPKEINPRSGRIHTDFRQAVAATGRLSSSDPNLQNIPIRTEIGRSIRDAFVAREGWQLLSADYSQIELRVLAHLSHDRELLDAFGQNADVHTRTARAIFGVSEAEVTAKMRGQAKTVNYAVIYGQTQFALARNLRIERSRAAQYIKAFFEQYSGVAAYMEKIVIEARQSGEVRTLCERVRKLPDLSVTDRVRRQAAERVARNTPIQGSAADIVKLAMIAIEREIIARKMQSKMLLTVHDELVFEAPADEREQLEQLVCDRMEHVVKLDVPLVAERGWGTSWGQAH